MPVWWNWQTRGTQNPVVAIPCRFDPDQRHQNNRQGCFLACCFLCRGRRLTKFACKFCSHSVRNLAEGLPSGKRQSPTSVVYKTFLPTGEATQIPFSEFWSHFRKEILMQSISPRSVPTGETKKVIVEPLGSKKSRFLESVFFFVQNYSKFQSHYHYITQEKFL